MALIQACVNRLPISLGELISRGWGVGGKDGSPPPQKMWGGPPQLRIKFPWCTVKPKFLYRYKTDMATCFVMVLIYIYDLRVLRTGPKQDFLNRVSAHVLEYLNYIT